MQCFRTRHTFQTDAATFWRVFLDREHNRRCHRALDLDYELLFEECTARSLEWTARCTVNRPLPALAETPPRGSIGWIEFGGYERAGARLRQTFVPTTRKPRTVISSETRLSTFENGQVTCLREVTVDVRTPLSGHAIESFVTAQLRRALTDTMKVTHQRLHQYRAAGPSSASRASEVQSQAPRHRL